MHHGNHKGTFTYYVINEGEGGPQMLTANIITGDFPILIVDKGEGGGEKISKKC